MLQAPAFISQLQRRQAPWGAIYLLFGEEPLYQKEAKDALWHWLQQQGYAQKDRFEVDAQFDWQALQMETQAGNLFAHQRVIELEMPKGTPGKEGGQFIQAWCQQHSSKMSSPPETILLVLCEKLDGRQLKSKWVQAIENSGCVVQAKPIEAHLLPSWCQQRAERYHLSLSHEAALALAQRVEGNLLAADQALQKLGLQFGEGQTISVQQIEEIVSDQAHYQLFSLSDAMLQGQQAYALQILQRLHQEGLEAPIVLWLLAKDIRLLYSLAQAQQQTGSAGMMQVFKQHRIWQTKQQNYRQALARHPIQTWGLLLSLALQADLQIKGLTPASNEQVWQTLQKIVLQVSGS